MCVAECENTLTTISNNKDSLEKVCFLSDVSNAECANIVSFLDCDKICDCVSDETKKFKPNSDETIKIIKMCIDKSFTRR
jgi:hypothetical protein